MYAIQLPSGEFLDLKPGQQFGFELQSAILLGSDASSLPGSYSFPADIPASPKNRRLLGFPDNVHIVKSRWSISGVWIFAFGVPFFLGKLTIRSASATDISISLMAEAFTPFKDVPLSSLDLGGDRAVPSGALSWATFMLSSSQDIENSDFAFAPVKIKTETWDTNSWVNKFVIGTNYSTSSRVIAPHVKLSYLLQRIFATGDYKFTNEFQKERELTRLLIYDHQDVRVQGVQPVDPPVLPSSINLKNHVPNLASGDFLKRISAIFNLGLFVNTWNKSGKLLPLVSILNQSARRDWTRFAIKTTFQVKNESTAPGGYGWKNQPADLYKGTPPLDEMLQFRTEADFNAALAADPNLTAWVFIESYNMVARYEDGTELWWKSARQHQGVETGTEEKLSPDFEQFAGTSGGGDGTTARECLFTDIQPADWTQADVGQPYEKTDSESPLGLILFRGWGMVGPTGDQVPWMKTAHHVWDNYQTGGVRSTISGGLLPATTSEYSLNWHGEYGLFEKWHRKWHDAQRYGKHCTVRLILPVSELLSFNFEEKIRILGMEYIVKSLRVDQLLRGRKFEVEARLLSVI